MVFGGAICETGCEGLVAIILIVIAALAIGAALCFLSTWWAATSVLRRNGVASAPARLGGFAIAAVLAAVVAAWSRSTGNADGFVLLLAGPMWALHEGLRRSFDQDRDS